jgi:hypothetical protein
MKQPDEWDMDPISEAIRKQLGLDVGAITVVGLELAFADHNSVTGDVGEKRPLYLMALVLTAVDDGDEHPVDTEPLDAMHDMASQIVDGGLRIVARVMDQAFGTQAHMADMEAELQELLRIPPSD